MAEDREIAEDGEQSLYRRDRGTTFSTTRTAYVVAFDWHRIEDVVAALLEPGVT